MSACAGFLAVNVVLGALWLIRRQRIMPGGPGCSLLCAEVAKQGLARGRRRPRWTEG